MESTTNKPKQTEERGSGTHRRVKRIRRKQTLTHRIEKHFESIFGGRSVGNLVAALLLLISIIFGIWATVQSML